MSSFGTAVIGDDPNHVMRWVAIHGYARASALVAELPAVYIHPAVGVLLRALALHVVPHPAERRYYRSRGISAHLSSLAAVVQLLRTPSIDHALLVLLLQDALDHGYPIVPPRVIAPVTYDMRGYRPSTHYVWTRKAHFQLRAAAPPSPLPKLLEDPRLGALRPKLLAAAHNAWLPRHCHLLKHMPHHQKALFKLLWHGTHQTLPTELLFLILAHLHPAPDYSYTVLNLQ